ncbi:MAG: murein biosynthesis integral membrane protein MurJ [Planctomycetota bacterium]
MSRAGSVSAATMTSRVLGLLRDHIFAKLFGAGVISDALVVAFRIPNLLRDLFAEGALSSAFVPTFTQHRREHGDNGAFRLARVVLTFLLLVVGVLTLLGIVFTPGLVSLIAPGFDTNTVAPNGDVNQRELTIELTRWMLPFLLFVSIASVFRGILNSYHRYFLPALAPALFNVTAIAVGYGLWFADVPQTTAVFGWALAVLGGGLVQLLVLAAPLSRLGFRFRPLLALRDSGLHRIMRLMAPATLGLAAVQINIVVNTILASLVETGAPSWLQYGFRLTYLPIGVIGVAIATVSTVNLSQHASSGDRTNFSTELVSSLRLVGFLTLPATIGLIVLSEGIVKLLFQYGEFDARATTQTATALVYYSYAIFFFSGIKVLAPAFYALDRVRAPVIASCAGVVINLIWSLSTYKVWGHAALAFGSTLAAAVNFIVLLWAIRRTIATAPGLLRGLTAMLFLSLAMGAAVYALHTQLVAEFGTETLAARCLVLIPIAAGATIIFVGGRALRLPEAYDLTRAFSRKRG